MRVERVGSLVVALLGCGRAGGDAPGRADEPASVRAVSAGSSGTIVAVAPSGAVVSIVADPRAAPRPAAPLRAAGASGRGACDFGYEREFVGPEDTVSDGPVAGKRGAGDGAIDYNEPSPPGVAESFGSAARDAKTPPLLPAYTDSMPLFPRAAAWDVGETRCFQHPRSGDRWLTEAETYDLYRAIAEHTTGVGLNITHGRRSVVGLRGAYPGTVRWNGNAPNRFNDTLVLLWVDDFGEKRVREFAATTDVGLFPHEQSSVLRPNRRYRYTNGLHGPSEYSALTIAEHGYVVRDDSNHNGRWDGDRDGWRPPFAVDDHDRRGHGHNIHMASVDGPLGEAKVGIWSAGCQVIPGIVSWTAFIESAWTGMSDGVDYFLVDVRDIPSDTWDGPCWPDGSLGCPFRVASLPFEHQFSTAGMPRSVDRSSCFPPQATDGPEVAYALVLEERQVLSFEVVSDGAADLQVLLLEAADERTCLARDAARVERALDPGRYFVVVDTVEGGAGDGPSGGAYALTVRAR